MDIKQLFRRYLFSLYLVGHSSINPLDNSTLISRKINWSFPTIALSLITSSVSIFVIIYQSNYTKFNSSSESSVALGLILSDAIRNLTVSVHTFFFMGTAIQIYQSFLDIDEMYLQRFQTTICFQKFSNSYFIKVCWLFIGFFIPIELKI